MIKDVMSVAYTELDNGCPALCFCSDISIALTNKTMVQSFINYMDNDLKFKIIKLKIQNLAFTYVSPDAVMVYAKVNDTHEFMGMVNTEELYSCMTRVLDTLKEVNNDQ